MAEITRAFCVELDEVVTITQARRAFLQMDPKPGRLNFLCADPKCRVVGVPVSGVNYQKNAEDSSSFVTAHFRIFPQKIEKNRHVPGCEWETPEQDEDENGRLPGETEEQAQRRHACAKAHDYVDYFEPQVETEEVKGTGVPKGEPRVDGIQGTTGRSGGGELSDTPGMTRTRDFERLVESYREIKEKFTAGEFDAAELSVQGIGRIRYKQYFRPLRYCTPTMTDRVIYGGVRSNIKRYGAGFLLSFMDKLDELPVTLYVSSDEMKAYRHRKYLESILAHAGLAQYFTAYVLGHFEPAPEPRQGFNLTVSKLDHLVLIPKFKEATQVAQSNCLPIAPPT